jgi:hypothetical protein
VIHGVVCVPTHPPPPPPPPPPIDAGSLRHPYTIPLIVPVNVPGIRCNFTQLFGVVHADDTTHPVLYTDVAVVAVFGLIPVTTVPDQSPNVPAATAPLAFCNDALVNAPPVLVIVYSTSQY